jgi:hypothetical protein
MSGQMNKTFMHGKSNFKELEYLVFKVTGAATFNEVTTWMDDRFVGLPLFHKSVELGVKRNEKLIQNQDNELRIPDEVFRTTAPHLYGDLKHLIEFIQREPGVKSFGLLHLSVKLSPQLLSQELKKRKKDSSRSLDKLIQIVGERVRVPVILAVASRKTDDYYESLAVGINGVSNYCSVLSVTPQKEEACYLVKAGIEISVLPEHINSFAGKLLDASKDRFLPSDFFNNYLKNHLESEREKIVKTLCEYVFHGCRLPDEESKEQIIVEKLLNAPTEQKESEQILALAN